MLVGATYSGKSSSIRCLNEEAALHFINPKALTTEQLFGRLDPVTRIWSDGVVPQLLRECQPTRHYWMVFDGPVDAVWIENMNTVLDDNRKLCLTSGEIIRITENTRLMFEVADLAAASPATISRCGMVFMEPPEWPILLDSFLEHNSFDEGMVSKIRWLIDAIAAFIRKRKAKDELPYIIH